MNDDVYKNALKTGAMVGVVAAVVLAVLTCVGFVPCAGCFTGPISFLVLIGLPLVAGGYAANTADWSEVEADDRNMHGVNIGVRAGGAAALIAVIASVILSLAGPVVFTMFSVLTSGGNMDAVMAAVVTGLMSGMMTMVVNIVFGVISALVGMACGALAGFGVASMQE